MCELDRDDVAGGLSVRAAAVAAEDGVDEMGMMKCGWREGGPGSAREEIGAETARMVKRGWAAFEMPFSFERLLRCLTLNLLLDDEEVKKVSWWKYRKTKWWSHCWLGRGKREGVCGLMMIHTISQSAHLEEDDQHGGCKVDQDVC